MVLTPEEIALGRRNFMKALAGVPPLVAFGAAAALRGPRRGGPVKAGFIGPGLHGKTLLGQCRKEFIDLRAVCDINPQRLDEASDSLVKRGWAAARKRSSVGPSSTTRPAYMTATRFARVPTTARSWLT